MRPIKSIALFLSAALMLVVVIGFNHAPPDKAKHEIVQLVYDVDHQVLTIPENRIEYPSTRDEIVAGFSAPTEARSNSPPENRNTYWHKSFRRC